MASGSPAHGFTARLLPDEQGIQRVPLPLSARLRTDEGFAALLTVALLIVINGLVLFNAVTAPFIIGYDTKWHIVNAQVLSTGHLPEEGNSDEFFSPPLAYLLPAVAYWLTGSPELAGKVGQFQNFPLSVGITLLMVALARWLSPDRPFHGPMALLALGILPVYYKSLAFFRGEPLLTFFLLAAIYVLCRSSGSVRSAALVGLLMGLAALARQWAILAIPALGLYAVIERRWRWKQVMVAGLLAAFMGGWFYVFLTAEYGTPMAFNREPGKALPPLTFFTGTGNGALFSAPVRKSFDNQVWPILYSDTWGDYWLFWAVPSRSTVDPAQVALLAQMNLVNLLPTAVVIYALARSIRRRRYALLYLVIGLTMVGFLFFLIRYPNHQGDNIKGTYVLQMYPLVALIVGGWLARYWRLALVGGVLLLIHNRPLFAWSGLLLPPA